MCPMHEPKPDHEEVTGMTAKEVQQWLLEERGEYHTLEEVERTLEAARLVILADPEQAEEAEEQRMLDRAYELQRKIDAYEAAAGEPKVGIEAE